MKQSAGSEELRKRIATALLPVVGAQKYGYSKQRSKPILERFLEDMEQIIAASNQQLLRELEAEVNSKKIPYLQDSNGNYLDDKEPRAKIRVVANEAFDQVGRLIQDKLKEIE